MTTAMTAFQQRLAQQFQQAQAFAPITQNDKRKIEFKNKFFILPDGAMSKTIDVIILHYVYENGYWPGVFDPSKAENPVCWSLSDDPNNMVPDETVEMKQCDSCIQGGKIVCPKNEFGSEGRGKACKNRVRLAVIPVDATEETPIWTIRLPPTSTKHWMKYLTDPKTGVLSNNVLPIQIVTAMGFDPQANYDCPLMKGLNEHKNLEIAAAKMDEAIKLLNRKFTPRDQ